MIISVHDYKKQKHNDRQKEIMYDFDEILKDEINSKNQYFPKLYRELDKNASLMDLSVNIAQDFGLKPNHLHVSVNNNYSYYLQGSIYLLPNSLNTKNIEVFFHEYAHLFTDLFFNTNKETPHGAEFVSTLRFLLNYYEIIHYEDFDDLLNTFAEDLECFNDYIVSIEDIPFEQFQKDLIDVKNKNIKQSNKNHTGWTGFLGFERETTIEDQQYKLFLTHYENNKHFKVILNQRNYEYDTPFSKLDEMDIEKTILFSNVAIINESGYIDNKYNGEFGFSAYIGHKRAEFEEGKIISTKLHFGEAYFQNFDRQYDIFLKNDSKLCKNDTLLKLKQTVKEYKDKGFYVVVAKSFKEYEVFKTLLEEKIFQYYRKNI